MNPTVSLSAGGTPPQSEAHDTAGVMPLWEAAVAHRLRPSSPLTGNGGRGTVLEPRGIR